MRRSATPSRSTLLAAIAVASLAAIGVGASAIQDSRETAVTPAPEQAAPVAIASPAPTPRPEAAPQPRAAAKIATEVSRTSEPVGVAGLRATLNTDGVQAAPTADATFNQSFEGLHEVTLADGSVMVDLEGRFQVYTVQVRDASGKVRLACVHDPARAGEPCLLHTPFEPALPSAER